MQTYVAKVVARQLGGLTAGIQMNATFEALGFDSRDCIEFILTIEHDFSIEISDELALKLQTPQDIVTYLEGQGLKPEMAKRRFA